MSSLTSPPTPVTDSSWLQRIADSSNLTAAWEKVRHNAGAPGVDGVTISAFESSFDKEAAALHQALLNGRYQPHPVRAVDIPKPSGGLRTLGIPTVKDRVVQQAISQVLSPVWEALFSPSSHAYRRGHDALDAVAQVQQFLTAGREWIVDLDIEKFFDHIHHDSLLAQVRAQVPDEAVLALIRAFLEAGVLRSGYRLPTTEGTPQGSPLSPLLANIVLDAFDQRLDQRGQCFSRYADDVVLLCATEAEARAALEDARSFLSERLELQLNESKTRLCTPPEVTFLGFAFQRDPARAWRRVISTASLEAFRFQVDQITDREDHIADLEATLRELASYVRGWENYYDHPETAQAVKKLRSQARTAIRRLFWRQWATPERRKQELVRRGIIPEAAQAFALTCSDPSAAAASPVLGTAIPNAFFASYGLAPSASASWAVPYGVSDRSAQHPAQGAQVSHPAAGLSHPAVPAGEGKLPAVGLPPGGVGLHLGLCLGLGSFGVVRSTLDLHIPSKKGDES